MKEEKFLDRQSYAELMMSAGCDLNCEYCYIGKNKSLAEVDKKIIEEFKKGIPDKLENNYGRDIKLLALWGSETTLYLEYLVRDIKEVLNRFRNLEKMTISSNFYNRKGTDKLIALMKNINKFIDGRDFEFRVQSSLDGPPFINDISRKNIKGEGVTNQVADNIRYFIKEISNIDLKPNFKIYQYFKSTLVMDKIRMLIEDKEKFKIFYKYFDKFKEYYCKQEPSENFHLNVSTASPSLVIPGEYTVKDGKDFAKFISIVEDLLIENSEQSFVKHFNITIPYLSSIKRAYYMYRTSRVQNRAFSCGASGYGFALGLEDTTHLCHRAYLLDQEEYLNELYKYFDKYQINRYKKYRENFISKRSNKLDFFRQRYVVNGNRDFSQLQISYNYAAIKMLALADQAHYRYVEDDELTKFAAIVLRKLMGCILEAVLQNGSVYITPLQELKVWVNGALQNVINSHNKLYEGGLLDG